METTRLNIGGGDHSPAGWVNIDRASGGEAYPLDQYAENSVDEIRASHILEHFGIAEVMPVLREWCRVLKPGGRIRIAVPDLVDLCRRVVDGDDAVTVHHFYGGQTDTNDFHRNGFDEAGLRKLMAEAGFINMSRWESSWGDCASLPISLNIEGFKPTDSQRDAAHRRKIMCVMSVPRFGPLANAHCVARACNLFGIGLHTQNGAFWGQCLTRGLEAAIADGVDWILTADYDTIFEPEDLAELASLFEIHPEVDALAALQIKRQEEVPILATDEDETGEFFDREVSMVRHAHFGLTLFRASSFARVPKPWFVGTPAPDGGWGDGRIDDDIHFWRVWRECGNTVAVAPRVSIGHLQEVVTWPGRGCRPLHQYLSDYYAKGKPPEARV